MRYLKGRWQPAVSPAQVLKMILPNESEVDRNSGFSRGWQDSEYNRAEVVTETGPGWGGGKVLVTGGKSGVRIDSKGN